MGNTFGRLFRVTTFGESHGPAVGCVVDGVPPGVSLEATDVQAELDRRRPGQSRLTTQRKEGDRVEILSGVFEGRTLGTPIGLLVRNQDQRPEAYDELREIYRPSHADLAWDLKFGLRDHRGGGRSSARETVGRVAAGAVARAVLGTLPGFSVRAWVARVGEIDLESERLDWTREAVEAHPTRCPDPATAARMEERILAARSAGDSVGGVVAGVVEGLPVGLGEPVFDRFEAELAHAMLGLPATKGFEIGSGFAGTRLQGSQHNDPYRSEDGRIVLASNRSGGVQGGITVGAPVWFRVAFKPTATIALAQETVDRAGRPVTLRAGGRHDPCVLPRAVPIVEAMACLVAVDLWLQHRARQGIVPPPPAGRGAAARTAHSGTGQGAGSPPSPECPEEDHG